MGVFQGTNFLSGHLSGKGTVGKKAWDWGKSQGYSDTQLKVAVQQLMNTGIGINNAPGQFFSSGGPMRGVPGMYSPKNPMGQFQGSGGNMGLKSYMSAKQAGYSAQEIKEGAAAGGMFLPVRATAQYNMDMQAANERDQQLNYMQQLIDVVNRPQPGPSRVGRSSSYVVGTGGAAELQANQRYKKAKEKYKGSKKWSREAFNAVNASAATGAGGGTVNP